MHGLFLFFKSSGAAGTYFGMYQTLLNCFICSCFVLHKMGRANMPSVEAAMHYHVAVFSAYN